MKDVDIDLLLGFAQPRRLRRVLNRLQLSASVGQATQKGSVLNASRTRNAIFAEPVDDVALAGDLVTVNLPAHPTGPTLAKLVGVDPPAPLSREPSPGEKAAVTAPILPVMRPLAL